MLRRTGTPRRTSPPQPFPFVLPDSYGRPDPASGCALHRSEGQPASLAGSGADRGWGVPPCPRQRGLHPLWTLPPGGKPSLRSDCSVQRSVASPAVSAISTSSHGSVFVRAHGCAPVPAQEVRPLPWREAEWIGVGGFPSPHQRGRRPLWTLPPDGRPSRRSDCSVQRVRCFTTRFRYINEQSRFRIRRGARLCARPHTQLDRGLAPILRCTFNLSCLRSKRFRFN